MIPRATYRIQFGKDFGFDDAAAIAPYLAGLGISHVYTSPYLQARPGSKHGYDIINHNCFNSELGGEQAHRRMLSAFASQGLGHILDYVPNHMGVGGADNPFWLDVLEWGRKSRHASWFDIDWDSHSEYLNGKLLVPFLANQYGVELESGRLELRFDEKEGSFSLWLYGTHKLPVTPPSYPQILGDQLPELKKFAEEFAALKESWQDVQRRAVELKAHLAERVATEEAVRRELQSAVERFRGRPGELASWDRLDSLIHLQHWRPTHFRVAADDINYRRFFNISELAGLHMEEFEVFEHAHRLVFRLLREGALQGLRIDHIDGLYNPREYLERLGEHAGSCLYLVVEKILGRYESLREDWPIQGTTGYDFCADVTALLVDIQAEEPLTRFYREFTGELQTFAEIVREAKIKIMENELGSELESLAREAVRVARQDPYATDFTRHILCRALKETIACFPVYRTYVDGTERNEADERYIHWAIAQATKNEQEVDKTVFEFLERLLKGDLAREGSSDFFKRAAVRCAMKAQQLSGPVMAKGLEDTALYRYNRLIALNEVGSSPEQFGISVGAFHKENLHRAEKWPHTMLATSTHDTKHGEDGRARLAALSLVPEEWASKAVAWSRILRARRGDVQGTAPPARNDEYLFFQNLIATWPAELTLPNGLDKAQLDRYAERLQAAMIKSLREERVRSNWMAPNAAYENAVMEFVRDALNPEVAQTFLDIFLPFQRQIAEFGVRNSLVQVLLKMTSPGVPDVYQGSELWDLSLPDPDNRKQINFADRQALLGKIRGIPQEERRCRLREFLENWHDGAIKLAIMQVLLEFRRERPSLFENGSYEPMQNGGESKVGVCAFVRRWEQQTCLAMALLDARVKAVEQTNVRVRMANGYPWPQWRDVLTEQIVHTDQGALNLAEVFEVLPIALLVPCPKFS
ncbi:MAG TPA: malto-oligosyltrehalose synthase [Candidatus Eremiobacteraceae bacterium]|nr:malto-oligosyltrehalose synthase [Candidatus Eremiobacteraceae bacterium]